MLGNLISGNMVAEIMGKQGPHVQCVILRENGVLDEITIDMTPKVNAMAQVMGGALTIVGQYPLINTVVLKRLEVGNGSNKNSHKLPHPLHEEDHFGDILLVRMNEEAEPESVTKTEWTEFLSTAPFTDEAYNEWKKKHVTDEDEDEDDVEDVAKGQVGEILKKAFKEEHGRDPNEGELKEMLQNMINDDDDDEEEEGEELTEEEEKFLEKTTESLRKKLKREPMEHEVAEVLQKTPEGLGILQKLTSEEEDEEEEGLNEEEAEILGQVMEELTEKLEREPTEAEVSKALAKHEGGDEILAKLKAMKEAEEDDDEEDDDDGAELDEEEHNLLLDVNQQLTKRLKRDPTDLEIIAELKKRKGGESVVAKLMGQGDEDEDDDDEEEDEEDEDEPPKGKMNNKRHKRS